MKNIAVLCPHRESDQWTVPISFIEEFRRLGYTTKVYSTFDLNDNYSETGLKQIMELINRI